jgi:hypothetical protein
MACAFAELSFLFKDGAPVGDTQTSMLARDELPFLANPGEESILPTLILDALSFLPIDGVDAGDESTLRL